MCLCTCPVLFFLLVNTCFTTFFLEILFCKAKGPGPLSLTTGLMARITTTTWPHSVAGNPSLPPSNCRPRPPEISSVYVSMLLSQFILFSFFLLIVMRKQRMTAHNSLKFSSIAQSCLTLCSPMNLSTPGLSVHHQLLEFTQTHVH